MIVLCALAALTSCSEASSADSEPARESGRESTGSTVAGPARSEPTYLPRRVGAPPLLLPNLISLPAEDVQIRRTDDYDVETPGQSLPLSDDLADGVYCLTLTADPANLLRESDDTDNATVSAVRIAGTQAAGAPPAACERSP